MKCFDDHTRDAVGACTRCGKGVCPEDAVYIEGKLYCKECAKIVLGAKEEKSGKTLYRSRRDRIICGVCRGLADYFEIDPVLMRIIVVLVTVFTGIVPGIVAYLILCAVVPEEPRIKHT